MKSEESIKIHGLIRWNVSGHLGVALSLLMVQYQLVALCERIIRMCHDWIGISKNSNFFISNIF